MKGNQSINNINNTTKSEIKFEIITLKNLSEKQKEFPFDLQKHHRINHYNILVITTGLGFHYIDFVKHDFTRGSILFVATEQVQAFDFKPGNDGYLISFTENFLTDTIKRTEPLSSTWLYNYHLQSPKIQVKAVEQDHFFGITEKMYQEYHTKDAFAKDEIIQSLLNLLLLRSERIKRTEFSDPYKINYSNLFFKYKNLCEEKYAETRNVKQYAEELNISYKHLNNICKQCINKTAKQFIDDYIILESKRYLLSTNRHIKEISETTGFDESTNFVKYFKKHTNLSPEKFRKKHMF